MLTPPNRIAYCTNVHAGTTLEAVQQNFVAYSIAVRDSLVATGHWGKTEPLGLGLWFSDTASQQITQGKSLARLGEWLEAEGFSAFTMNGFPQGDFHQKIVKQSVYFPTWWETARRDYTLRLINILDSLLPGGEIGSISTLPIAWSSPSLTLEQWQNAAENLLRVAEALSDLEERTGRQIVLAIEPEPGCALTDSASLRAFFERWLLVGRHRERVARYLTCCHDICHAGVMFEDQQNELDQTYALGLRIGKVQVSSAIHLDWDTISENKKSVWLESLQGFAEDRYLHQTMVRTAQSQPTLHEDLPELLAQVKAPEDLTGQWRIHFHVPIFYDHVGEFGTTRHEIGECLQALRIRQEMQGRPDFFIGHFEIETYAWSVLPAELQNRGLAEDIADELRYFRELHDRMFGKEAAS